MSYWNVKSREVIDAVVIRVGVDDETALRKAMFEEVKKTMQGIRVQKTRLRPPVVQMGLL